VLDLLGLDAAAESVYRAMLADPRAHLADLGAAAALTPAEVRRALDRLAELSLLRPSWEEEGQMRPVSPEIGLEALLIRQQAELAAHQQRIEASRAAAAGLIAEYAEQRAGHSSREVEHLAGLDRIRDRLAELTRQVKDEVCSFAPGGAQTEQNLAAARPLDEQLLRRGVRMSTVYLDSARHHPPTVAYARWLTELGGRVRTVPSLPVRMKLIDRRIAVMPVNPDASASAAVVLHGPGTVTALAALFDHTWAAATPFGEAKTRDQHDLTPQQREVLRLLVAGHTDETVSKRLGVSVRTARRIASELMERLNAQSRFQAGYRLALLGWLRPEAAPADGPHR
jgi:DNA-binding CsgD family transcriptional regulator